MSISRKRLVVGKSRMMGGRCQAGVPPILKALVAGLLPFVAGNRDGRRAKRKA